jgi:signal transduction histidine kinase
MPSSSNASQDTGLDVLEIEGNAAFAARPRRPRETSTQMAGMQRVARAFVATPQSVLKELTDAALLLCNADSAGISLEAEGSTDADFYHWAAASGQYTAFTDAALPRYPSACGLTLERQRPQLFRVRQAFFDILGVAAPLVTDGLLLPWETEGQRGTIFIMAHGRTEAFDLEDVRIMQILADFAAMGLRQQRQQQALTEQASAAAAAAMANHLAHQINNPLQSLTNVLYLAAEGQNPTDARTVARQAAQDLTRLSSLVRDLLALPISTPAKR